MAFEQRKQREKEEMQQKILQAAKAIFLERGYHQTSIRNIADKIEYSPGTIYLYFKEKNDIFLSLHNEAFTKFFATLEPVALVDDPFDRIKTMGRKYMQFAFENKDLYDLMFIMNAPMDMLTATDDWLMGKQVFQSLTSTIVECKKQGRFAGKDEKILAFVVWSGLHGMCALFCRSRMNVMEAENEEYVLQQGYQCFEEIIEGL